MQDDLSRLREEVKALQEEQQKIAGRLDLVSERLAFMDRGRPQEAPARTEESAPSLEHTPPAGLKDLQTGTAAAPALNAPETLPAGAAAPGTVSAPLQTKGASPQDLEAKIGGIWLNRIGMIVFLLGAAFFLKLAYDWGWINETVRVLIGAAAATVLLGLGERNRRRGFLAYGQGLTAGGIALLYFVIFASFYYYSLISSIVGMSLLILVTTGAVTLAVYQNARAVAMIGLLTGFLNPALFVAEEPRFVLLMLYLILLNLGIAAVVYFKRWKFIGIISFILTNLFLAWVLIYRSGYPALGLPAAPAQIYFTVFLLLFPALPLLSATLNRRSLEHHELFLLVAGAAAYYGLSWFNLHPEFPEAMGWFTLGLAGFYLLAGAALLPVTKQDPRVHFTSFSLGAVLLVLFVPLQLKGAWILAGWTLEAVVLCFLGMRLADKRIRGGFWIVLFLALAQLLTEWNLNPDPAAYHFLINKAALLTFGFIAVLLLLNRLYHHFRDRTREASGESIVLAGAAGVLLLICVSLEINHFGSALAWRTGNTDYYHNLALLMISLFWGVYAAGLMIAGFIRKLPLLRYAAIALFGLTVAKVILFDLSFLELAYRIISLVISGLILLAVSYLYQHHRSRIDSPMK